MSLMVGGEELRPPHDRAFDRARTTSRSTSAGSAALEVDNVDLQAGAARSLGIAGLTGSGREEVLPLLFGAVSRGGDVLRRRRARAGRAPRAR